MRDRLDSGQAEQVRQAVLVPPGRSLPPDLPASLQAMGPLSFDLASIAAQADGTISLTAISTPANAHAQRWTIYLVHEHDTWLLAETVPQ